MADSDQDEKIDIISDILGHVFSEDELFGVEQEKGYQVPDTPLSKKKAANDDEGSEEERIDIIAEILAAAFSNEDLGTSMDYEEKELSWWDGKASTHKIGDKWKGPSGRWFTRRQDGRVVPTKAPGGDDKKPKQRENKEEREENNVRQENNRSRGKPQTGWITAEQGQEAIRKLKEVGVSDEGLSNLINTLFDIKMGDLRKIRNEIGGKASGRRKVDVIERIREVLNQKEDKEEITQPDNVDEEIKPEPQPEPEQEITDGGTTEPEPAGDAGGGTGSEGTGDSAEDSGGSMEEEAGESRDTEADQGGESESKPDGKPASRRIPASKEEVDRKINRFENFFRKRGQHQVADWMGMIRNHVNTVGTEAALESLGAEPFKNDKGEEVQYWGVGTEEANWKNMGDFIEAYLMRNGIVTVTGDTSDPNLPLISALGKPDRYVADQDFKPSEMHFKDKLTEAKTLPGLEKSEDISTLVGKPVTNLDSDVINKLDETYGKGKWIVKCYDDNAAAGYGIFFPQRAQAIMQDARNTIWTAGEQVGKYGFTLNRDKEGKIIGLKHKDGATYDFGTDQYNNTINGDVRNWADRAAAVSEHENGAKLPEGSFMAQPAFEAVGISDAERAAGKTWHEKNEGRVHLVTKPDGSVDVVPHSTWLKGGNLPVVFEDEDTKAMAQAAKEAIEKIPPEARKGQVYAPDVMKTKDGYRVVELNAQGDFNGSGYLHDNHFTIDAYVSHLTGRQPSHVKFIRDILTKRERPEKSLWITRTWTKGIRPYRVKSSPFTYRKSLSFGTMGAKSLIVPRIKAGYTGRREDKLGRERCYANGKPVSCGGVSNVAVTTKPSARKPAPKPQIGVATKPKKARASLGDMQTAKRVKVEGGKDYVVMGDGSPPPPHIKASMIQPDWTDVKVSMDPDADILVTATMVKNGKVMPKRVYSASWNGRQAAAKFARTQDGLKQMQVMAGQIQEHRKDPEIVNEADCAWLMQEQATRPGSESDNKGVSQYFGIQVKPKDVVLGDDDKVFLRVNQQLLPIKDKKTKAEILKRKQAGGPMEDSTYWLKSFGATSLEGRHVIQKGDGVYLEFVGKESVWHSHKIRNPELAKMLLSRKGKAGAQGKLFNTDYASITNYTKSLDGGKFTPKDFRTQRATSMALQEVMRRPVPENEKERKKAIKEVGTIVSGVLGNEPAQALTSYIDPAVFAIWNKE